MVLLSLVIATISILSPSPGDDPRITNVVNQVEGQTTILSLVGEGARVKKGQLIGELDSALIRDKLTNQKINLAQAEAASLAATKALEIAEAGLKEVEAATEQEIKDSEGAVRIAELDIKINTQKIADAKIQQKIGQGRGELDKATIELAKAEAALTRAKAKLRTLVEFTRKKRMVEADSEVQRAKVEVESTKAILALEKTREAKLKKQITACELIAPVDGQVYYANPEKPRPDGYVIGEGAIVRERQTILRIVAE